MKLARYSLVLCLTFITFAAKTLAETLPGAGIKVTPVQSTIKEETFQTMIIIEALKRLGYDIQPTLELTYREGYQAVASGRATFSTTNWDPLQKHMYEEEGGNKAFARKGHYIKGAAQGYLIDKNTAEKHNITNIGQLSNPSVAKLFDWDGNGKADLVGCEKSWGCAEVTQHQLEAYGLKDTVDFIQGVYAEEIKNTISQFKQGHPIIYYTWTPYWLSGILIPNKDVVWLEVPFSAHPRKLDTKLANGKNYGFRINSQRIISNLEFANANPAAAKLFEIAKLPINDVSAQNKLLADGEDSPEAIKAHVDDWIDKNQKRFNYWIDKAKLAGKR